MNVGADIKKVSLGTPLTLSAPSSKPPLSESKPQPWDPALYLPTLLIGPETTCPSLKLSPQADGRAGSRSWNSQFAAFSHYSHFRSCSEDP